MQHVAVIGAGPMGLMCAYELLKKGYQVTLFERDSRIGGMSASFELGGTTIERFYHFICGTDEPTFNLLRELGIDNKLVWQDTKMGFYYEGKLYSWGDPFSLLKFPKLSLFTKLRYGLHVFYTKNIQAWEQLDRKNAVTWIKQWIGKKGYDVLWKSLFHLKFYEYQHDLSAAWIGARIKRVAKSRKSLFKESLGYLQGGSDTLLNALEEKIKNLGGKIMLKADVNQVVIRNQQVCGVQVADQHHSFDQVISTIPLPYLPALVPDLPVDLRQQILAIKNVGVRCVVLKLQQQFSPYFWMNINDSSMAIPGMIEYSNLNPAVGNVVYVPYYMPQSHPKYQLSDEAYLNEVIRDLKKINPAFHESWILASHVARYHFAQTVCTTNFYAKLPTMQTAIKGFYIADTAFYYPEDRSIAESVEVGAKLARMVVDAS